GERNGVTAQGTHPDGTLRLALLQPGGDALLVPAGLEDHLRALHLLLGNVQFDTARDTGHPRERRGVHVAGDVGGDALRPQPAARDLRLHRLRERGDENWFLGHALTLPEIAAADSQLYQTGRTAAFSFRAAPRKTNRSLVANVSTTMPPRRVRTVTAPCGQVLRNCAPTFWYACRAARLSPWPSAATTTRGRAQSARRAVLARGLPWWGANSMKKTIF